MAALARLAPARDDLFSWQERPRQDRSRQDRRQDRALETPLRSLAGAELPGRRFTAWRGRSGRRYVASVFAVADDHALGFRDAVLLAVSGDRRILAARDGGGPDTAEALERWRQAAAAAGAGEIHVHLLAEDAPSRRAALRDLMPGC